MRLPSTKKKFTYNLNKNLYLLYIRRDANQECVNDEIYLKKQTINFTTNQANPKLQRSVLKAPSSL